MDSAARGEFAEKVTGPDGGLASAARLVLGQLGVDTPVTAPETATDADYLGVEDSAGGLEGNGDPFYFRLRIAGVENVTRGRRQLGGM